MTDPSGKTSPTGRWLATANVGAALSLAEANRLGACIAAAYEDGHIEFRSRGHRIPPAAALARNFLEVDIIKVRPR